MTISVLLPAWAIVDRILGRPVLGGRRALAGTAEGKLRKLEIVQNGFSVIDPKSTALEKH
jgi:hypothetical protein